MIVFLAFAEKNVASTEFNYYHHFVAAADLIDRAFLLNLFFSTYFFHKNSDKWKTKLEKIYTASYKRFLYIRNPNLERGHHGIIVTRRGCLKLVLYLSVAGCRLRWQLVLSRLQLQYSPWYPTDELRNGLLVQKSKKTNYKLILL